MNKLSCFIATTLIGSSISVAHAEPKMSGTIYLMTEVEHNNKTGVTNTTISDKSSSLYLSDEVRLIRRAQQLQKPRHRQNGLHQYAHEQHLSEPVRHQQLDFGIRQNFPLRPTSRFYGL